jgi:hypothetical protein
VTLSLAARMTRRHSCLTALPSHVAATLVLSGRKRRARKHACDSGTRNPHQHDAQQKGCSNSGHSDHYSFSSCDFREQWVCDSSHTFVCFFPVVLRLRPVLIRASRVLPSMPPLFHRLERHSFKGQCVGFSISGIHLCPHMSQTAIRILIQPMFTLYQRVLRTRYP